MEVTMENILIKELNKNKLNDALSLVWKVFNEYEAPDYSKEGIEEFHKCINDTSYLATLRVFGAFEGDNLLGVIATRSEGTHIALFFVDGKYHRQGIGKKLVSVLKNEILRRGKVPFYSTVESHIISQKTALTSGFYPVFAEVMLRKK